MTSQTINPDITVRIDTSKSRMGVMDQVAEVLRRVSVAQMTINLFYNEGMEAPSREALMAVCRRWVVVEVQ
jgi:hypothetical protein